jgi:uncharacterized protein YbcI
MIEHTMLARPSLSSPLRGLLNTPRTAVVQRTGERSAEVRTQGEIEAAVCAGLQRFEQDHLGRGPKNIQTHLFGDLIVARLMGVLTAAEQQLAHSCADVKGRDLLKQVRTHLIETARPILEEMIHKATGVRVLSLHHDISTVVGEEIIVFILAESPCYRELKRRR